MRIQAKVRKRWLIDYLGNGVEKLSSGFRGVGLRGHPSSLSEEALNLRAPPDGFAGVATPMSPPLEVRRVQLVPEEVDIVIVDNGFVRNEKEVVKELRRNREFGIERVVLVRRGVIGVAIDAFLVLFPSLRLLTTVSVGVRVLLLVTGDFLLILVVTPAGGRVVVLYRLGSGWLGRGRPLVDEGLESLCHAVQGRSHASFRLLNHGAHLIPAGGSGGAPTTGVR